MEPTTDRVGFWLIVAYVFLDYIRPQDIVPGLAVLHLPMIVQAFIALRALPRMRGWNARETKLFLAMLFLMAAHSPFVINHYWAYHITRGMTLYFFIYMGLLTFANRQELVQSLLKLWVVIAFIGAVRGYLAGGRVPNSAFLGDENDFCLYMNISIAIAVFLAWQTRSGVQRLFYLSACTIFVIGIVLSMSRGGFVGLVPTVLYCLFKSRRKVIGFACVGILVVGMMIFVPGQYWDEVQSIEEQGVHDGTGAERWYTWKIGWKMFTHNPLFGIGPGNFNWTVGKYETPGGFYGRSLSSRAAHSLYFTVLPEQGITGTVIFASLFFGLWRETRRKRREGLMSIAISEQKGDTERAEFLMERMDLFDWQCRAMGGAMLAYFVSAAFLSVLYYPHLWVLLGLAVARNMTFQDVLDAVGEKEGIPEEEPGGVAAPARPQFVG